MKSYPFTSQVSYDGEGLPRYDRAVDSEFLRAVFKQYFSDGVFYNPADALQVTADTGMNVQVAPGACHIQGAMAIEDSSRVLAVQASGDLDRIDTVVARLDLALGVRSIDLYVLKGTPAETPAAPELTRNNTVWELGLADLFITKSTTEISQQRITDTRLDTARCGQVIAPAAPADLEPYFAQLQAAIAAHDAAAMKQIAELGRVIAEAGQPYNGIMPYTHTKSGTVHQLIGSGNNIKFAATAAFAEGDSVAVNGNTCTAKTISGDALWGGFWTEGAVVSCWLNETGDALNFSGAGLSEADKAKLVPGNLLDGVTIHSGGVTVAGSIPRKAAAAYTPGTSDQVLAAGQYLEGAQSIKGDVNLVAGNIRSGASIFGVTGAVEKPIALIDVFTDTNNWDRILARVLTLDDSFIASSSYSTGNGGGVTIPLKRSASIRIYIANARDTITVTFTGVSSVVHGQRINVPAGSNMYLSWRNNGSVSYLITEV